MEEPKETVAYITNLIPFSYVFPIPCISLFGIHHAHTERLIYSNLAYQRFTSSTFLPYLRSHSTLLYSFKIHPYASTYYADTFTYMYTRPAFIIHPGSVFFIMSLSHAEGLRWLYYSLWGWVSLLRYFSSSHRQIEVMRHTLLSYGKQGTNKRWYPILRFGFVNKSPPATW